jgi:outer membrane protein assembly factor BamD
MKKFYSGLPRLALLAPVLALGLALSGCSGTEHNPDLGANGSLLPAGPLYANGVAHLQKGEYAKAVTEFDDVEETYPYSSWASHAQLLAGYAQYKQQNYDDAISSIQRFISLHPVSQETAYAYYLKALCYYEQIDDVQRDQTTTYEAIQTLTDVVTRYPDSAYARDARIKLRLAENRLAGHDMVVGRFYERQHLYGAAVGRYQDIVNSYQTTTYVPEALERLVECYLELGLTGAAQRDASVLAYNYPGSSWYQAAYDKLKAHHLITNPDAANAGDTDATPPPKHHGFFFGLL